MADKNVNVAARAAGALILSGDLAEIYEVGDQLDAWKGNSAGIVGGVLEQVKDLKAVPALVSLMQRPEVSIRHGAVYSLRGGQMYALRNEGRSVMSVAALIAVLDDADEAVQYNAIMALAYQTQRMNPEWAWGLDHFRENPKHLVDKWKQWWQAEGKDKYPSVETVLKEYEKTKSALEKESKSVIPAQAEQEGRPPH